LNVLTLELTMSGDKYKDPQLVRATYRQLWERLERLPGVASAGGVSSLPLSQMFAWGPITVEGRVPPPGENFINADERVADYPLDKALKQAFPTDAIKKDLVFPLSDDRRSEPIVKHPSFPPSRQSRQWTTKAGLDRWFTCVSMGNPHCVTFVDRLSDDWVLRVGPEVERHAAFPRRVNAEFIQMDALSISTLDRQFDSVIDCGLFHVFSDEDRQKYVAGLAGITKPGGRIFLACFSDEEPGEQGPRRISRIDLRRAFADGWVINSIEPIRFEVRPSVPGISFSSGGPKAWFATIRRI
jgi:hypothetical protein